MIKTAYEWLPLLAQSVLNGLYTQGKSSKELALQLGKKASAVSTIASRAIQRIQWYLATFYDMHISTGVIRFCIEEFW